MAKDGKLLPLACAWRVQMTGLTGTNCGMLLGLYCERAFALFFPRNRGEEAEGWKKVNGKEGNKEKGG